MSPSFWPHSGVKIRGHNNAMQEFRSRFRNQSLTNLATIQRRNILILLQAEPINGDEKCFSVLSGCGSEKNWTSFEIASHTNPF
jgi:hypothetical protein